jgi:hypothetical protein
VGERKKRNAFIAKISIYVRVGKAVINMVWLTISIGTISILLIFIGIAFVPASCMSDNTTIYEWMQDHTVKVNSTTTCKYEQGQLLIKEVYTGEELKERFGIEYFTKELKMPVDDKSLVEGKVLGMQEGEEKVFVTEKVTVLTSGDDPPPWWDYYNYPQWVWLESGGIYERNLPINLAWKNTTKDVARSEILEEGWVNVSYPFELTEYVYDPIDGWIADDEMKWLIQKLDYWVDITHFYGRCSMGTLLQMLIMMTLGLMKRTN